MMIIIIFFSLISFTLCTGCNYPTFYDSDSSQCVMTCPNGTNGVVNGASGVPSLNYTRNCTTSKFVIITMNIYVK